MPSQSNLRFCDRSIGSNKRHIAFVDRSRNSYKIKDSWEHLLGDRPYRDYFNPRAAIRNLRNVVNCDMFTYNPSNSFAFPPMLFYGFLDVAAGPASYNLDAESLYVLYSLLRNVLDSKAPLPRGDTPIGKYIRLDARSIDGIYIEYKIIKDDGTLVPLNFKNLIKEVQKEFSTHHMTWYELNAFYYFIESNKHNTHNFPLSQREMWVKILHLYDMNSLLELQILEECSLREFEAEEDETTDGTFDEEQVLFEPENNSPEANLIRLNQMMANMELEARYTQVVDNDQVIDQGRSVPLCNECLMPEGYNCDCNPNFTAYNNNTSQAPSYYGGSSGWNSGDTAYKNMIVHFIGALLASIFFINYYYYDLKDKRVNYIITLFYLIKLTIVDFLIIFYIPLCFSIFKYAFPILYTYYIVHSAIISKWAVLLHYMKEIFSFEFFLEWVIYVLIFDYGKKIFIWLLKNPIALFMLQIGCIVSPLPDDIDVILMFPLIIALVSKKQYKILGFFFFLLIIIAGFFLSYISFNEGSYID